MSKKVFSVLAAAFLAVSMMFVTVCVVSADPVAFKIDSYTFDDGNEYNNEWFFTKDGAADITSVSISDPSIISVEWQAGEVVVYPMKTGTSIITATGADGSKAELKITVLISFFNRLLNESTRFSDEAYYGAKAIRVFSEEGAAGTLSVGRDKYKVMINSSGYADIKIKKLYKVNTKLKLVLIWNGCKTTKKSKIRSNTSLTEAAASGKKVKLNVYDLHAGDTVTLVCGGKTYTKPIKKNHRQENSPVTFLTRKKVSKSAALSVKIKNRFKQTLYNEKIKLVKGKYVLPEEEEEYYNPDNYSDE